MNNKPSEFERSSRFLPWLWALLLTALVAGCGGGGGDGGRDPVLGAGDIGNIAGAPTVTFVAPLPKATGVPINTKIITAAFSEAMDPATLTAASFTLACPAGTPVTGAVSYLATGNEATFTLPAATNLPPSTVCTATITTAARDATGVSLTNDFVWTFTTGLAIDTTAPTVTGTTNLNGATGVAVNTKIVFTYSEPIDPLTINATTFTVKQGATPVAGTVTHAGLTSIFTPASNLAANTAYTVTATTGVKDTAGNPMASDFVNSWTTGAAADTVAPIVTGSIQSNGQTDVAINTNVGATFSEAMDPLTVTTANFAVTQTANGTPVAGVVTYSGVSAVFNPVSVLAANTSYTVIVKGGASGVKDLAGNPMVGDWSISWTTGAAPDTTPPLVTATIQSNGQINVAVNTKVGATFSEGMDPLTITNVNLTLQQTATGTPVSGVLSYSGVTAVFIPLVDLTPSTNYTVTVKGGASGVKDLAGNPMVSDFVISWTTGLARDITAPTVIGTVPLSNATNVAINTKVGASFSEAMDPLTMTGINFWVREGTGNVVGGTWSYSGVNILFAPFAALKPSTVYNATILKAVKDLAGNEMVDDYVWSFTTAATAAPPPPVAPTVTLVNPADGAGLVCTNNIAVTFSEAMDPLTITTANFTVMTGGGIPVTIPMLLDSYNLVTHIATFVPTSGNFPVTTPLTATVTTGVKNLAGTAMAADKVWNFTTGPRVCVVATNLGAAQNFAVIAGSTITNAAFATSITGDVGLSTGLDAAITGFPPGLVVGTKFTASAGLESFNARAAASAAYQALKTQAAIPGFVLETGGFNLGGSTLPPGTYHSDSTLAINAVPLTLDPEGDPNAVWIIDMNSALTTTAGGDVIILAPGKAKNVFWRVGSDATLGAAIFKGNLLADSKIILGTQPIDVEGRLFGGMVALEAVNFNDAAHTVVRPAP